MTKEERCLLIKDLCARLPYGVYCKIDGIEEHKKLIRIEVDDVDEILLDFGDNEESMPIQVYISEVKPYLIPLSDMTEEEEEMYDSLAFGGDCIEMVDWMNIHHLDYRGLIDNGLALEAPSDLYKFE